MTCLGRDSGLQAPEGHGDLRCYCGCAVGDQCWRAISVRSGVRWQQCDANSGDSLDGLDIQSWLAIGARAAPAV